MLAAICGFFVHPCITNFSLTDCMARKKNRITTFWLWACNLFLISVNSRKSWHLISLSNGETHITVERIVLPRTGRFAFLSGRQINSIQRWALPWANLYPRPLSNYTSIWEDGCRTLLHYRNPGEGNMYFHFLLDCIHIYVSLVFIKYLLISNGSQRETANEGYMPLYSTTLCGSLTFSKIQSF